MTVEKDREDDSGKRQVDDSGERQRGRQWRKTERMTVEKDREDDRGERQRG